MREKGCVREMEKAGCIVYYGITLTKYIVMSWDIAVEALVNAKETKEVGWCLGCTCTPFTLPEECGKIVSFTEDSAFTDVKVVGQDV